MLKRMLLLNQAFPLGLQPPGYRPDTAFTRGTVFFMAGSWL
jgi:hypothetical protein